MANLTHITNSLKETSLKISICLMVFLLNPDSVKAQAHKTDTLFLSDEIINLELSSHFSEIRADTSKDPKPHPGKLIYHSPDGKTQIFNVKVRARGDFRRNPEICTFPPLLVNFRKSEVRNTIFNNQDKLKLVTACQREEDVVEEYVIYKLYNQVTDLSLKVRLVKVRYFDTRKNKEVFERYSFFIEHEDQMAERNDMTERNSFLTPFDLDRENFVKMAVFEYLIGNRDWFIASRRNVIILQSVGNPKPLYSVPYDFDFAGLIDASYTKPRDVPEKFLSKRRVYKGLCNTEDEFGRTFELFRNLKPVFESIINNQELISKATRKENLRYLEGFYTTIEDKELFKKEFLDVCETRKMYNLPDL
jgi:hypothetical protein